MEHFPHLASLGIIYAIFFLQNASPGVNVMAVMGTSMDVGRSSGLYLGAGVAFGTFTWSTLSVAGLSAIIVSYGIALQFIKYAGAAYLFLLAYKSLKSAFAKVEFATQKISENDLNPLQYFWRGYLINMTNPKAALGWIAIVSLGLKESTPWWVGLSIIAGTTTISLIVHIVYAVTFSTKRMVVIYNRARRPIQGALGLFFIYAGQRLLTAKI